MTWDPKLVPNYFKILQKLLMLSIAIVQIQVSFKVIDVIP